ncbi:MAG TPA: UDP-N-acetylmuramate dehydrogenase [Chitinophagaceae bacterium]|nr:UDP-N-acetylmuramate dehydrogenase [Chitinophagaceae bacterium]
MNISEHISLKNYNSFGIEASARYFASFRSGEELLAIIQSLPVTNRLIVGEGTNILLAGNFDGLVCRNEVEGITELHEDMDYVYVRAGAGIHWHSFVRYCIDRGWAGLENLSLIPGTVGAAPIQNIGAYGVEMQDCFWSLEALHLNEGQVQTFTAGDCEFGYRDSVFKRKYRGQFAILNVTFRLRKKPVFHISYGALPKELEKMGVKELSIDAVSQAVMNIRRSKLPDPAQIGNAGSFFKNPMIDAARFENLKSLYPGIAAFPLADGHVKLAAAWLIEQCGWKGYREGDAGCHEKQALVLVNYGKATGREIVDLSRRIRESVQKKFDVTLETEVNIIGA